MEAAESVSGQCGCGSVRIEARGPRAHAIICHCLDCQKRTGSPYGFGLYYPEDAVSVTGATTAYARPTLRGHTLTNQFCPRCGTTTHWTTGSMAGLVGLSAGIFAPEDIPAPDFSVYDDQRLPWVPRAGARSHRKGTNTETVE